MNDPIFRRPSNPLPLAAVAAHGQAELPASVDPAMIVDGVAPLATARRGELTVAQGEAALEDLRATRAGACFVLSRHRDYVPRGTVALVTQDPLRAFLNVAALIDPGVRRPGLWRGSEARHPTAIVHAEARVEPGAVIGPGAVLGPRAEIGGGTSIGANCFIDADVRIGRGCSIGPNVTVSHALVGDEVIVHAGACIGVVGTGAPSLGRAILQNGVELGSNAVVVRGATGDTVVGEGARVEAAAVVAADRTVPRFATVSNP